MTCVTAELALRIEKSEVDHFLSWAAYLKSQTGNPFGIEIGRFGDASALANNGGTLGPLFNRVLCFSEADLHHLPDIVAFYCERGLSRRIDINPYQGTSRLFKGLADAGLYTFRFHSALYAGLEVIQNIRPHPKSNNVRITRIGLDESAEWADVWQNSFIEVTGASSDITCQLSTATSQLCGHSDWTLYLARVDEQPAAAAAMYVQDGMASLAIAGTLPEFRGKGCQTELLKARIADAANLNCDLAVAQAALGASSQNNMERVGMKIAYTRAFWLALQS